MGGGSSITDLGRDVLEDYEKKMRDAENESHEGKRRVESTWWVFASDSQSALDRRIRHMLLVR